MICSVCLTAQAVTLTHSVRIGRRTVTWTECLACWRKAEVKS